MNSTDSAPSSPTKKPKVLLWIGDKATAMREGFLSLPPVAALVQFNTERSEHTFWVIPPGSASRRVCAAVATNSWFESVILIAILLSSVQLAVSRPAMGVKEADFFENMGWVVQKKFTGDDM